MDRRRLAARWRPHFDTEAELAAFLVTEVEADRQARRAQRRVWLMMLALSAWVLALIGRKWGWW